MAKFQPDTVIAAIRGQINKYQENGLKQSAGKYKKPRDLNDGIKTATLKEVSIDEKMIDAMTDSIINGNFPNIHSVLILRNDKLVYENYFPGKDQVRGQGAAGFTDHHLDSLHDIRSVSKSVVGTAIMIAIGLGKIKSVEQRVFDFFPEYAKYDTGMKRRLTIKHLMNMAAGLEWDEETISYADSTNSERRMNNSSDAVEFVLRQKLVDTPGKKFNYSGGCTQVLASIVAKSTGMPVDKFTQAYLFTPLGIQYYTWVKNADGQPSGASGLRLRSRDMAKLGLLFLSNGKWNGRQIIPARLVSQTSKSQIATPYSGLSLGYSNQFWIPTEKIGGKTITFIQAQGNGGQIILIEPGAKLVVVITGGNYNQSDLRKSSWDIYPDFIYPAILK